MATEVTQNAADAGRLLPMLDGAEANTGSKPNSVLADAGYRSEENFRGLEERGIEGYVALGREGKKELATKVSPEDYPATQRMQERLQTRAGQAVYRLRKCIAEAPFGWAKSILGFRQFSLRGLGKVGAEWHLVCLAVNLKRLSGLLEWA